MANGPVESSFEMPVLDQAFFDRKPGLDEETKAVMRALFSETQIVSVYDYCDEDCDEDFPRRLVMAPKK